VVKLLFHLYVLRITPSNVRSNEYDSRTVFDRYKTVLQDLVLLPSVLDNLSELAQSNNDIKAVRGMLKVTPGMLLF
jgi:hypothetical protein